MKIIHVHNVAFVATTLVDALNSLDNVEAIFFEREAYNVGLWTHLKNMISFKKLIKKEKPDIVHIHYLSTSLYALFAKTKYVLHVHGSDVRGLSDTSKTYSIKERIYRKCQIYALKKAELVFYSTPNLKKDVETVRKDAIFIPNPVKGNNVYKEEHEFKNGKINILFFAALWEHKGADIAFPALKELANIYGDKINIVCINFGYQKDKYNKYEFVNYVDKVPHKDINQFISQFDIIIGQLKAGAIGVSELEVMMQGIPLVSNFKYNEFYPEECPLISCDNSVDVVKSVQRLIEDVELRKEVAEKQFEWVNKYHKDTSVALKLRGIYETICAIQ